MGRLLSMLVSLQMPAGGRVPQLPHCQFLVRATPDSPEFEATLHKQSLLQARRLTCTARLLLANSEFNSFFAHPFRSNVVLPTLGISTPQVFGEVM